MSHGQAAVERGFSVHKEALAPYLKEDSLKAICLVHDTTSAEQIEIAEFVITDDLLTSCSCANNRYKMYLMDKEKEAQEPEKARKKSSARRVDSSKEKERGTRSNCTEVSKSDDKKGKEAEKKTDVATMKALLIEANASRKKLM